MPCNRRSADYHRNSSRCFLLSLSSGRLMPVTSNSLMDISADGKLLACSNRDSGTVTIVDLNGPTVLHEIAVGAKPEGVTFIGKDRSFGRCGLR